MMGVKQSPGVWILGGTQCGVEQRGRHRQGHETCSLSHVTMTRERVSETEGELQATMIQRHRPLQYFEVYLSSMYNQTSL